MIDACGVIRSHPLLSQAWNVNVFPATIPLFREEFATCSPVAQRMALESFIMRSARWMGLKRKNGV